MTETTELKLNVIKLTNNDIIIGNVISSTEEHIIIEHPYSIYDIGQGPCVMPYELPTLLAPMESVTLRMFDVMWVRNLDEFSTVKEQYLKATSGLELPEEELLLG